MALKRAPRGRPLPRLREIRIEAWMSQQALAHKAGLGIQTVVRADAGRNVEPDTARKLAAALGVTVETLLDVSASGVSLQSESVLGPGELRRSGPTSASVRDSGAA